MTTHEYAKTRLLQDHGVMIICVSHSPSTHVTSGVLAILGEHKATVSIWPLLELARLVKLNKNES